MIREHTENARIHEANIIVALFRARKLGAHIAGKMGMPKMFMTPSAAVYKMSVDHGQPISAVVAVAEDLSSFLNKFRRENNLQERQAKTTVRIDGYNLMVEISRPEVDLLWPHEIDWTPEPMTALVGQAYDFAGPFPLTWKLDEAEQPHALIAGTTGSGKTNATAGIILSLAWNNSPRDLIFTVADLKPSPELRTIHRLPHVVNFASGKENALKLLRRFHSEMEDRYRGRYPMDCRHMMIVDEHASILGLDRKDKNEARQLVDDIAARCREAGMNLLVSTQKPTVKVLGDLKANLQVRIVGAVMSKENANNAANLTGTGAHLLPGKGAMIYRLGQFVHPFQAPYIENFGRDIVRVAAHWNGTEPVVITSPGAPIELEPEIAQPEQPEIVTAEPMLPPALRTVLDADLLPDATFRHGGVGRAIAALNGGVPVKGRAFQELRPTLDGWVALYLEEKTVYEPFPESFPGNVSGEKSAVYSPNQGQNGVETFPGNGFGNGRSIGPFLRVLGGAA